MSISEPQSTHVRMHPVVLATVGLCGTGKSEVTQLLATEYSFKEVYFGGFIIDELKNRRLEINNLNERLVREELRRQHGMDIIARRGYPKMSGHVNNGENVVIDGLYSFSEYEYLKSRIEERLVLLALHSPKALRNERLSKRAVRPLSLSEIDERDVFEIKNLEKGGPIAIADYHVVNDRSLDQFLSIVRKILEKLLR